MVPDPWEEGLLFKDEIYTVSYSLHLDALQPSVLITVYCKKELLRCGLMVWEVLLSMCCSYWLMNIETALDC